MFKFIRKESECNFCPFKRQNKVWGEGAYGGRIIFMGEAPGKDEDRLKRPFVGRAGQALNKMLAEVGIKRNIQWVTNRISCRPPNNNFFHPDSIKAVRYCKKGLYNELKFLKEKGYTIVVPFGDNALKAFGLNGIGKYKEKILQDDDFGYTIFPLYHPSYIVVFLVNVS